ncbi:hypothetical protein IPM19_00815 [bacterium]|nr:MAG: hypothetical protein IPM19_00815 [bacterium]
MKKLILIVFAISLTAAGCGNATPSSDQQTANADVQANNEAHRDQDQQADKTINFSSYNSIYKFTGLIPADWEIEYIQANESINIYDPKMASPDNLEKSQIFIRHFRASSFLTLTTVDILKREQLTVGSHAAVMYEIKKKTNVPNFPNQPLWRSGQHTLIDIRYSADNPSEFYVIAKNPSLDPVTFDVFIDKLKFEND